MLTANRIVSPRRVGAAAAIVLALCVSTGCASYTVRDIDEDEIGQWNKQTVHALFWGALYKPPAVLADCQGHGLDKVVVERNLLHDVVSVATLGFWMPIDIRYICHAPPATRGDFPED